MYRNMLGYKGLVMEEWKRRVMGTERLVTRMHVSWKRATPKGIVVSNPGSNST